MRNKGIELLDGIEKGLNINEIEENWTKKIYKNYKPIDFSLESSFEIRYIKMSRSILMELRQTGAKTLLDYFVVKNERNNRKGHISR